MTTDWSFDPFSFDLGSQEYSPYHFYTSAYNKQDHTTSFRWGKGADEKVNIMRHILALAQELRQVCPQLKSNSDVIRDALFHYLKMRQDQMKDGIPQEWQQEIDLLNGIAELERLQMKRQRGQEALDSIESSLREARTETELSEVIRASELTALSLDPEYMQRAANIIDRYRR